MTKVTTKYLIVASVYFFICAGGLGYSLYTLGNQSAKLESLQAEHFLALQKEQSFIAIAKIIEGTAVERAELATYFITERDTISYIAAIEEMAKRVGVTLVTNTLTIVPKNDKLKSAAYLGAGFTANGSKEGVRAFMEKIEHAPFHQTVTDMSITTDLITGDTSGTVLVQVTLAI
jgi:hypothetical protein